MLKFSFQPTMESSVPRKATQRILFSMVKVTALNCSSFSSLVSAV